MTLLPGDKVTYGLSLDLGNGWVKLSAETTVQPNETTKEAVLRAETAVDALLIQHAAQMKKVLDG